MNKRLKQSKETQLRMLPKSQMPRPPSEAYIKKAILKALGKLPYVMLVNTPCGKAQVNGGWIQLCPKGWPDLSGLVGTPVARTVQPDGTVVTYRSCAIPFYLEVKTDAGRLHGDQQSIHDRIRSLGGYVAVVRSVQEALDAVREARGE